jgi:hypothetical protein
MSVDVVRSRLLVTVEDKDRPRVLRIDRAIDAAAIREVLALMAPMLERLGELARRKLVERNRPRE